ncbi:efflux RND transporter periplasmic adaptor subunit [Falsiphaeobacter marinintestinus]|uniref:efflux RND transporter periplasmic adaptor subunit n=1 Tax=Falsiphaeobacter marinintestinus TaxID=1492905 RepID=UPI001C94619E|nr:efflux RND transporter periplasmic adaptor subunit [Phaeobacter marinintestinus]
MFRFLCTCLLLTLTAPALAADDTVEFPGRIEALNQSEVSNAVAATVTAIHFSPGEYVTPGDLLFTLDKAGFELAVETEVAFLLRAEATLKSAARDFERMQRLQSRGSATGVQVLKAEVAQAMADAVRAETRARVKAAQMDLARTDIRAPISGVISAPSVKVGSYVKVGNGPLATIMQLDPVRLSYEVPYIDRVESLGLTELPFPESLLSSVTLTVKITESWTHPHRTRPSNVDAVVNPVTGTLTIWAELPNPDGQLRPGMRVRVLSDLVPAPD